ncbi:MAG TPA: hypothetical protein DCW42_07675 [Bacteroidetes bacterium]|nr:hypothetical protein [Bacteroidota bacterium]
MKKILLTLSFFSLIFCVNNLFAKDNLAEVTAYPSKLTVAQGEKFWIKVDIKIQKDRYTYSFKLQEGEFGGPTQSEIHFAPENEIKIAGKIRPSKPKVKYDSAFFMNLEYYKGKFSVEVPVIANKALDFSKDRILAKAFLQICTEENCLPPDFYIGRVLPEIYSSKNTISQDQDKDNTDAAVITNTDQVDQAKSNNTNSTAQISQGDSKTITTKSQEKIQESRQGGIFSFLWFAMTAGALALLTPCVFPMIPITVSFFTKRSESHPGKALRDSTIYATGIIFTFTAIGFLLAIIFGATGIRDFASNGWVNLAIGILFIVFAFNLFGAFEIQIPTKFLNVLNAKSGSSSGVISVLLMGLTFSLTSFTCTVPFVGSALIAASGGEWFYPIIGMLGFSAVFAAPFFLLSLFPSFLKKMPKSGGWMNNIKVVMGFLEIAFALKFISNVDLVWGIGILPKDLFLAIWTGISLLITLYILGLFRFELDSPIEKVSTLRVTNAIIFAAITFYLMGGLFGRPLGELDAFLPPAEYQEIMNSGRNTNASIMNNNLKSNNNQNNNVNSNNDSKGITTKNNSVWLDNLQSGLELAKTSNQNVLLDFTGFTCTNCRWMEQNMFKKPEVQNLLDQMVKVRLFTDRYEEPYLSNKKFQQEKFGSIELPLYVILKPTGEVIATETFTRDYPEFLNFLRMGISTNL